MTDDKIEQCARACEGIIADLTAQKTKLKKGQKDRRAILEIEYAIRALRRAAERVRALKSV